MCTPYTSTGRCVDPRVLESELLYQRRFLEAEAARKEAERRRAKAIEENRKADLAAKEAALRLRELERAAANRRGYGLTSASLPATTIRSTVLPCKCGVIPSATTPCKCPVVAGRRGGIPYPPPLYDLPSRQERLYVEDITPLSATGCTSCQSNINRRNRRRRREDVRVDWSDVHRGEVQAIEWNGDLY
jgi:hypothetical protein